MLYRNIILTYKKIYCFWRFYFMIVRYKKLLFSYSEKWYVSKVVFIIKYYGLIEPFSFVATRCGVIPLCLAARTMNWLAQIGRFIPPIHYPGKAGVVGRSNVRIEVSPN